MCERFVSNPGAPVIHRSRALIYTRPRGFSARIETSRADCNYARPRCVPLSTLMVLRAPRRAHHRRITQGGITRLITREKLNIETINRRRGEAPRRAVPPRSTERAARDGKIAIYVSEREKSIELFTHD